MSAPLLAALAGVVAASLLAAGCVSRVRGAGRLPARVRSLAARGAAPAEIARRTGLSRDGVVLLLGRGARAA